MAAIPHQKLEQIVSRYERLQTQMADPSGVSGEQFGRLSKEYADLTPLIEIVTALRQLEQEIDDLGQLVEDSRGDREMHELAQAELLESKEHLHEVEHQLQVLLLPKDIMDEKNVILEIRAGTGGAEAALFAGSLLRMYQRYAELKGWKFEVLHESASELGGVKDTAASVSGKGVFSRLKFESGVHRVQRVPETESSGRIHTSAATVAVLPEPEAVDIQIDENDLRIDVFRASGPGGQSVNTTDSAVRITHLPTGLVVQQQDEKSQHKNRAKALKVLRARLFDLERERLESERSEQRRGQVGTGDRSERIRTYNFPQGRVTDHRINLTLYKLEAILSGENLDEVIDVLIAEDQAARLAALNDG